MAGRDQQSAASIRQSAAVSDLRFAACDIQALVLQSAVSGQPPAARSNLQSAICSHGAVESRDPLPCIRKARMQGIFRCGRANLETEMEQTKTKRKASCSITRTGCSSNRQRPILPDRFQSSTFGVQGLNYCVRHGNRWIPLAIVTGYVVEGLSPQNFMKRHCNVSSFSRTHFSH